MTGTIKNIIAERGFGFLAQDQNQDAIFFHANTVEGVAFEHLLIGQRVEFESEQAPRGLRATWVRVLQEA
jgi:cold shock protein